MGLKGKCARCKVAVSSKYTHCFPCRELLIHELTILKRQFARAALIGLLQHGPTADRYTEEHLAKRAFDFADAMIMEMRKRG